MNAGNLGPVSTALRAKYPEREIIIAGDDDRTTKNNPGATKASEAAKAINGKVAIVQIPEGNPGTDYNDLAALAGVDAVRDQIAAARAAQKTFPEIVEDRRYNPALQPPPLRPVFKCGGVVISTPGNITSINAQVKAGKTAVVTAMIASTTAIAGSDALGFTSENSDGRAVLHFDTEQSIDDHWHGVARLLRRAGRTQIPPWLWTYCLTGFDALKAWQAVTITMEKAAQVFGGIHSVLIDGVADLVRDVNDAEECNAFVASLHALALRYDCPIVTVLHFNPGTEKTRGHLGSQLERKSETNLRLEKTGEVTEMWSDKQRRAPILKGKGPRFKWSDEEGMHVSIESGADAQLAERVQSSKLLRDEVYSEKAALRYSDLVNRVQNAVSLSPSTAKRRVNEWVQLQIIEKSFGGLWIPKN